jgi:hypothetical protein
MRDSYIKDDWLQQYAKNSFGEDYQWYIELYALMRKRGMHACPSEISYMQYKNAKAISACTNKIYNKGSRF